MKSFGAFLTEATSRELEVLKRELKKKRGNLSPDDVRKYNKLQLKNPSPSDLRKYREIENSTICLKR